MPAKNEISSVNVAVLRGELYKPPQWRRLTSGESVTTFDVKVCNANRSEIVRVSWMNAPTSAMEIPEGEVLVAIGRVRTYWSGKRSETDVLARCVMRAQPARDVRKAIAESMAELQASCS